MKDLLILLRYARRCKERLVSTRFLLSSGSVYNIYLWLIILEDVTIVVSYKYKLSPRQKSTRRIICNIHIIVFVRNLRIQSPGENNLVLSLSRRKTTEGEYHGRLAAFDNEEFVLVKSPVVTDFGFGNQLSVYVFLDRECKNSLFRFSKRLELMRFSKSKD